MLQAFADSFKIPDLRKKILITLGIVAVYRLGTFVPTPGIDGGKLALFFDNLAKAQGAGGTLFGMMNIFSGGAIHRLTIFALGIMPYISSSIIMQLLTVVVPQLEKMAKEGEAGRRKINQYTRYGTIILSVMQSFFIALWLEDPSRFGGFQIVANPGWSFRLLTVLTLTTGSTFIMWLGEQIQEKGIGNGMSLLITANILSRMPTAAIQVVTMMKPGQGNTGGQMDLLKVLVMIAIMIGAIVVVIWLTQAERKIPVQYAKRIVGRKVFGGQSTFIPFKVNNGGVMPIIFAQSIIMFPATIGVFMPSSFIQQMANAISQGSWIYEVSLMIMIIFFSYFYTAIAFNPVDVADNMKKYGGFIPGVRPGESTAQYFDFIINRITLPGGIVLGIIAIAPDVIGKVLKIPYQMADFFGGTALLIVVGVSLDTIKQIESQLVMRHYEGFMKHGRIRGRQRTYS
ncbi:MAG: preprotein translocase subunit SecY [Candidatus Omnitrophota bacterium]